MLFLMFVDMRSSLLKTGFVFLLFCGNAALSQVRFFASISPSVIGKDEYAQLKLTVENAQEVQAIDPPRLKNLTLVSGPNQESGMSMVNGNVNRYLSLSYIIKPQKTGSFFIPPTRVKADGAEYLSNSVTLKVVAKPTGNSPASSSTANPFAGMDIFEDPAPKTISRDFILRKGEDPVEKINKNMFVKLEADRTSCYVGEPVVATYKLYTRLKSESNLVKNPSFNGFSVIDLQQPDITSYKTEKVNGREYNVYIVRKVQLYPLLAGNLELGAAEVENNVHFVKEEFINRRPDISNGMLFDIADGMIPPEGLSDQKVNLRNNPVVVNVKPLPDANKPVGFKGAVGRFTIEAKLERDHFSTDDGGRLAVTIGGEGNLQLVNAPEVTWPEGVEAFDPKTTDDLLKGTVPVGGRKVFDFPFVVSRPGTYIIPALLFSFFDPRQNEYKTIQTASLQVIVSKGTGKPKVSEEPVARKEDSYLVSFFKNRLRVVSLVAVLIVCGLIFWLKKDTRNEKQLELVKKVEELETAEQGDAVIQAQQHPFTRSEEELNKEEGKLFYITLNEELKQYLSRKLSLPAEELNKRSITNILDKTGIPLNISMQLNKLIDEVEFQLYTPLVETGKQKELYDRAQETVQLLNTWYGHHG